MVIIKDAGFSIPSFSDIGGNPSPARVDAPAAGRKSGLSAAEAPNSAERTDKIEIAAHVEKSGSFLRELRTQLREEIDRDADAGRLRDLKESIGSGRYAVDSGALAGTLLFCE